MPEVLAFPIWTSELPVKLNRTWLGGTPDNTMFEPSPSCIPPATLTMNVSDDPPWRVSVSPFPRLMPLETLTTFWAPLPVTVVEDEMEPNVFVGERAADELDRLVAAAFRPDNAPVTVPPDKPLPPSM